METNPYMTSMPSPAYRDLEEHRITPDEYARRTRREVEELIRESPPPRRRESDRDTERKENA